VSIGRQTAASRSFRLTLFHQPAFPTAKRQIRLELHLQSKETVHADPAEFEGVAKVLAIPLKKTRVYFDPFVKRLKLHPLGKNKLGFNLWYDLPCRCKIDIHLRRRDEEVDEESAKFEFDVELAPPPARLNELFPDDENGKELTMSKQHQVMRFVAAKWRKTRQALKGTVPLRELASRNLQDMEDAAGLMSRFQLHKHAKDRKEFLDMVRDFQRTLSRAKEATRAQKDDIEELLDRLESRHCTRCHLKFRWGNMPDVRDYLDLRYMSRKLQE